MKANWKLSIESRPPTRARAAMEELPADGTVRKEKELEFYGKLLAPEELKNAKRIIHHEQWSVRVKKSQENAGSGSVRVRKSWGPGEDLQYVATTKVKAKDGSDLEHEVPTTEDHFRLFQYLADQGMVKTRYCFPVQGSTLVWEVDTFSLPDGSMCPWVKLDLEIPGSSDANTVDVPGFPIKLTDVIDARDAAHSHEVEEQIGALYAKYFMTDNLHQTAAAQLQPVAAEADLQA